MAGRHDLAALDRVAAGLRAAGSGPRLHVLEALAERRSLSPSEYAEHAGIVLREAAYHFRALRDGGLIVLHHLQTTGGTAQHFYELTPIGRAIVDAVPPLAAVAPPRPPRDDAQA
jgi:DNA-binding transcriptional ArsR family regulator